MNVSRKGSPHSVGSLEMPGVIKVKNSRANSSGTVFPK
jgi:hypothetical protein